MTSTAAAVRETNGSVSVHDTAVDAVRRATHIAHEARLFKSLAADAVEDGIHAVKRTMKSVQHGLEDLGDLKDQAAYRVKRRPLQAVAVAFGAGVVLAVVMGWVARHCHTRSEVTP